MSELLPCPFCGAAPVVEPNDPKKDGDAWTRIDCAQCHQASAEHYADRGHRKAAIKKWNRRAFTPTHGATPASAATPTPAAQITPASFASKSVAVAVAGRAPVAQSGELDAVKKCIADAMEACTKRGALSDDVVTVIAEWLEVGGHLAAAPIADEARDAAQEIWEYLVGEGTHDRWPSDAARAWLRSIAAERGETK